MPHCTKAVPSQEVTFAFCPWNLLEEMQENPVLVFVISHILLYVFGYFQLLLVIRKYVSEQSLEILLEQNMR